MKKKDYSRDFFNFIEFMAFFFRIRINVHAATKRLPLIGANSWQRLTPAAAKQRPRSQAR